ncbi:SNF2-related protein [Nitzschia inconspicua]|uniref:SNF2-related protein n=1 Tax=Nitzschia inconspicua TaxID=303405 RepID=A0A9K3PE96_9STRA|nr:SNF2-related protein [Nitzschia inconspicua]
MVYEGVESIIKSKANRERGKIRLLHPHFLADADIILVPFGALMSDLGHSDDNRFVVRSENDSWGDLTSLRRRKKYRIVPSPLLSVHFWRVAIDEAQRVEVTTAKAAKMALKLKADHFWAVSGTPIGQGKLEDIYGLFLFLGLTPLDNKAWFRSCLSPTVDGVEHRIIAMLKDCFWRSTKASNIIKKQLGIPEMTENRVILKFSSIERHFYSTQLSATLGLVGCLTSHSNMKSKKQMERLSESVQRLRAACCHPQVGTHGVTGGRLNRARLIEGNSVAARVLSMEQILDKFIDDARQKCEEAQRLAIMHTNAMAAITRLKSEARSRGIRVEEDDHTLLRRSGDMYRESLTLAEKNGAPQLAWGEAVLSGNFGFCPPNSVVYDGYCVLGWKIQQDLDEVWVKVEFQGTGKKLKQLRLKARKELPEALMAENSEYFSWQVATPVSVLLQVALASDSGEFLDVAEAPVRDDGTWSALEKFRPTNRSRAWRITVKLKQNDRTKLSCSPKTGFYIGLDVQLFEAHIDCDSLQLLHSLHNASHAYESAMQLQNAGDSTKLKEEVSAMRKEANQIESLYKAQPQILHGTCMKKFKELIKKRKITEEKLANISCRDSRKTFSDGWEDGWYNDFLSVVSLYGSESQKNSILERIIQDVDGIYVEDSSMRFPEFGDLTGLQAALRVRLTKIRTQGLGKKQTSLPATTADNEFVQIRSTRFKCSAGEHSRCMASIEALTPNPGMSELKENSHCRLCKADWNQIGPICKHCRIAIVLQDLRPDSATVAILSAIYSAVRIPAAVNLLQEKGLTQIADRARIFFELLEAEEREKVGAWKMWRTHLQLLNDYDELASTKQSTRLSLEGEDLTLYTEDQLNAIIQPIDLFAKYHDHAAKQAMFLGDLRRATGTLRYLQNQRNESASDSNTENCVVCLRALKGECCVLKCGHRFHEKPCFDQILRSNIGSRVSCPLKCRESTAKSDVMVATDKSRNDGSRASRTVKGSFGTKVTRIVSDVLTMRDKGEKGLIFSQWHTMLEIVETALWENGVTTTRPQAGKKFKDGIRQFQAEDCSVLLLPLKQAAEGLTLVEATNVFMIEPVMNSGLDQQAINRIHRIGQTKKCFVWRYLIEDTVEMKLDQIRLKNLEEDCVLEDNLKASRKQDQYSAGGCDGGFASKEELLEMLG